MADRPWSDPDRELVAQTLYGTGHDWSTTLRAWAAASEWIRDEYRHRAEAVLDALTAASWRPPPPRPDGIHWRTGTSVGRTIYNPYGDLAGLMHTPEQARAVVAAMNAAIDGGTDA